MIKDRIIKWAIQQIVKDATGSYAQMRYLEDVLENEMGEKMFIFDHLLVPIDKKKLDAYNARVPRGSIPFQDMSDSQERSA